MFPRKLSLLLVILIILATLQTATLVKSTQMENDLVSLEQDPKQIRIQGLDIMPMNQSAKVVANRTIRVSPYGFVTYNDSIRITNNDDREFNSILIFYNKSTLESIRSLKVIGRYKDMSYELRMHYYTQLGDYIGFVINLMRYVEKGTYYDIEILGYISQVPKYRVEGGEILFYIQFPQKILLPYNVSSFKADFETLDSQAKVRLEYVEPENGSVVGDKILRFSIEDEVLFNLSDPGEEPVVKFYWSTKTPLVFVSNLERRIELTLTEKIEVSDSIELNVVSPPYNQSLSDVPWKLEYFIVGLPSNVEESNIKARDDLGKITVSEDVTSKSLMPENYSAYKVYFRIPLTSSTRYKFTIRYSITSDSGILNVTESGWAISIPIAPIINTTILSMKLNLLIPYGFQIRNTSMDLSGAFSSTEWGFLGIIRYKSIQMFFDHITPVDNQVIKLKIEPSPFPFAQITISIFLLSLFSVILFDLAYVYYRRLRERELLLEEETVIEIRESLESFLKNYEEFMAVENRLDEFIRSRLTQRKSPKTLRDQLQRLLETNKRYRDRVLAGFEKLSRDPDIAKILKELRDLENRISFTRRELISDWSQFLRGALGKKDLVSRADELFSNMRNYKTNRARLVNRVRNIFTTRYLRRK